MRGHIKKLEGKRGTKWLVVLYAGTDPVTRKPKQIWRRFDTKPDAERFAAQSTAHIMGGGSVPTGKQTVSAFLEQWTRDYCEGNLSATSLVRYNDIIRLYLVPAFGYLNLTKLTPQAIQAFLTKQLQGGKLSPTTIVAIFRVLHKAMESALKWGMLSSNPCDRVEAPRKAEYEPTVLDEEQVKLFLAEAKRESPLYPIYLAAVMTGMRLGELLGLRWSDVNLLNHSLTVNQIAYRLKGEWMMKAPKTKRSKRTISIPCVLVDVLREVKKTAEGELVFPAPDGHPIMGELVIDTLRKILKKAKLPSVRFHDLRHAHATLLLKQGVSAKIVQERLGHSSPAITLGVYSHVMPGMEQKVVDDLEAQLFGSK